MEFQQVATRWNSNGLRPVGIPTGCDPEVFRVENTPWDASKSIRCAIRVRMVLVSSLSVRSRAISGIFDALGDSFDALDVEFGFSRVDFPPKVSKTKHIVIIRAKTLFFKLPVGIPTGYSALEFQQVAPRWNSNR